MRGKVDVETVMEVCEPLLLNFTALQCLERRRKKVNKTQAFAKLGFVFTGNQVHC